MPDNGFGSKVNSGAFLLRLYRVRADFKTAHGGSGEVENLDWVTLRDPDHEVPFAIATEGSADRLLTGGDFDVESVRVTPGAVPGAAGRFAANFCASRA